MGKQSNVKPRQNWTTISIGYLVNGYIAFYFSLSADDSSFLTDNCAMRGAHYNSIKQIVFSKIHGMIVIHLKLLS